MVRDPKGRPTSDGAQPEIPSILVPDETSEPNKGHNSPEADWLSMTTADPAFFLNDPGFE